MTARSPKQLAHLAALHERGHDQAAKLRIAAARRKPVRSAVPVVHDFFTALDAAGLTNGQLAEKTGQHRQVYINWRRGASAPQLREFEIAAKALGLKLALVPNYPEGDVVGPCICGSWPGGACLRCQHIGLTASTGEAG